MRYWTTDVTATPLPFFVVFRRFQPFPASLLFNLHAFFTSCCCALRPTHHQNANRHLRHC
jgi:hypothetical protein